MSVAKLHPCQLLTFQFAQLVSVLTLDLDVLELVEGIPCPISRRQLGLAPRQCFLCQADAKQCARSRQHSVADMQAYISQAVANYEAQTESP